MSELSNVINNFRSELRKIRDKYNYKSMTTEQHYREYHTECKKLSEYYLEKWPNLKHYPAALGYPCRVLSDAEDFLNRKPNQHGGVRPGAGRKKEEPTKQMRIPVSMVESVADLKDLYKGLSDKDKYEVIEQFKYLISFISDQQNK